MAVGGISGETVYWQGYLVRSVRLSNLNNSVTAGCGDRILQVDLSTLMSRIEAHVPD